MSDAIVADRIQFAFTVMCHYLFPTLAMGLAPLMVSKHSARAVTHRGTRLDGPRRQSVDPRHRGHLPNLPRKGYVRPRRPLLIELTST